MDMDGVASLSNIVQPERAVRENRVLNPVQLLTLVNMSFPKSETGVDEKGRFVIKGLEKREVDENGKATTIMGDIYPFAEQAGELPCSRCGERLKPNTELHPSDPKHPFTSLLKRKLVHVQPESLPSTSENANKRPRPEVEEPRDPGLTDEDRELVEGLRRFKDSNLGREIKDACITQ
jgi:hypothetical protein